MDKTTLMMNTSMKAKAYRELKTHCESMSTDEKDYGAISDEVAVDLVSKQFGFEKSLIEIVRSVKVWEQTSEGEWEFGGTAHRAPMYIASDWNYIRFKVCGMSYELVNDYLYIVAE